MIQSKDREPCPNAKVVKNLCTCLCADPSFTPVIADTAIGGVDPMNQPKALSDQEAICDRHCGIISLNAQNQVGCLKIKMYS